MYLHIGNNYSLYSKDIIGIFDIENTSTSQITKNFLNKNSNKMEEISYDLPKSFILCEDKIFVSPISVQTMKKRFINKKL